MVDADPLNFLRPHVLEDLGGIGFTQGHQQDRSLLQPADLTARLGRGSLRLRLGLYSRQSSALTH